jgi:hypothetical protein
MPIPAQQEPEEREGAIFVIFMRTSFCRTVGMGCLGSVMLDILLLCVVCVSGSLSILPLPLFFSIPLFHWHPSSSRHPRVLVCLSLFSKSPCPSLLPTSLDRFFSLLHESDAVFFLSTHVPQEWVNNPMLAEFCFGMIGRADIEESKSNIAMNAWLPKRVIQNRQRLLLPLSLAPLNVGLLLFQLALDLSGVPPFPSLPLIFPAPFSSASPDL